METILIPFTLVNPAEKAVTAVLIGASSIAASLLAGRILTDDTFKSEDGTVDIQVTGVPEGQSLARMQEFINSFGCRIDQVKALSDSHIQATTRFTKLTNTLTKPDLVEEVPTYAYLGEGFDVNKVIHNFRSPFFSAPDKSLRILLQPGKQVQFEIAIQLMRAPAL